MAKLIGYCTDNGVKSGNYEYYAEVETQTEIEKQRSIVFRRHNQGFKKILDNGFDEKPVHQITFFLIKPKGSNLSP
ncbi:MAG: hypothetical protein QM487_14305 [Candidatus Marithrix sp.]